MLVPGTEPFYFPGGATACLLIHGFTGSPAEMQPLGEFLAWQGYSVLGIRLFGHGTRIEDMRRARWQDWVHSVQDGWNLLQPTSEQVFLVGLSMGGVLALHQASILPAAGVISLSAPYKLGPDPRLPFLPVLAPLLPYVSKGEPDWHDPEADQEHFAYEKYPTRAIMELNNLLGEMRRILPQVHMPALLIQSRKDSTVAEEHLLWINDQLGTPQENKQTLWLEKSGHVITRDVEKETVFEQVDAFIQQNSRG